MNNGQEEISSHAAVYTAQDVRAYQGVPTIEALPPIPEDHEILEKLTSLPEYDPKERGYPAQVRRHMVSTSLLKGFYQPMGEHLAVADMFGQVIRQGYISRNPLSPGYKTLVNDLYVEQYADPDQTVRPAPPSNMTTQGGSILGISGVGKSSAVEGYLSTLPQKIVHTEYKGRKLDLVQLVWLKIDCPDDGSLDELCRMFFDAVDKALGTDYYNTNVRKGRVTRSYLTQMRRVATIHQLGVLVVDEIQHLSNSRSGGADRILGFLKMLVNTIGVPVIMIGTPAAERILPKDFQQARRAAGRGSIRWSAMKKDSVEWETFADAMWVYQWTRKKVPLTREMRDALYDQCQGIAVLAVLLYQEVQNQAILDTSESFGPESFKEALINRFFYMAPIIRALRDNDRDAISRYGDVSFKMLMEDGRYPEREDPVPQEGKSKKEKTLAELTAERLKEIGIAPEKARHYAELAIAQGGKPEHYVLTAVQLYTKDEESRKAQGQKQAEGDLREQEGYQGMRDSGTVDGKEW